MADRRLMIFCHHDRGMDERSVVISDVGNARDFYIAREFGFQGCFGWALDDLRPASCLVAREDQIRQALERSSVGASMSGFCAWLVIWKVAVARLQYQNQPHTFSRQQADETYATALILC